MKKLLCDDRRYPTDDLASDRMICCTKPATRFFLKHNNSSARSIPLRPRIQRCEEHTFGIFKPYFDEVTHEEYLVAEVMNG